MRFLFLTQYFPPEIGAPQIRLAAIANVLKQRGHDVEVVTALPNHLTGRIFSGYRQRLYSRENFRGIIVHRTWVYAATGTGVRRLFNYLSFALTSFIALWRARRPDYIFVESPPLFLGLTGWIFSSFRKVPMIFNVADLWPDSVRELGVIKNKSILALAERLERWIYAKSRFVNAVTEGIKQDLIVKKNVPTQKILFLPNGVDTKLFAPRAPDAEVVRDLKLDGSKVFVYAGTHGIAQGLDTLIQAAELLRETNMTFLLIGDGPIKQTLVEKAASQGLNNILFLGIQPIESMPSFFSIATASVAPLVKNELFKGARPSKIFPSLAAGIPVIFCGEGEAADMLRENQAGLVVSPENAPALAEAVKRLCADVELHGRLSDNGRRLAVNRFSWDMIVDSWISELTRAEAISAT